MVHGGLPAGALAQVGLLGVLAVSVGLDATGWVAGLLCGAATLALLARGLTRSGRTSLGPADRVTLTRAALSGGVAALVADGLSGPPAPVVPLVVLASVALALDAVDGRVARRTGTVSALGARFDMETDAFLLLVLSVHVAQEYGGWVLLVGAARYLFLLAGVGLPWLRGSLPRRVWAKAVAAVQGVVLTVAAADVLPRPVTVTVLALALALLAESFGRSVVWLWVRRHPLVAPDPEPADRPAPTRQRVPAEARDV